VLLYNNSHSLTTENRGPDQQQNINKTSLLVLFAVFRFILAGDLSLQRRFDAERTDFPYGYKYDSGNQVPLLDTHRNILQHIRHISEFT
jgi:hypothetical protein